MIKEIIVLLVMLFVVQIGIAQHEGHQMADTTATSKKPASPRLSAMAMIGDNHVHIDYGSPSVRGRIIWNGLVAYNQVWATGAHNATWIDFSKDVEIEGKHIPKGKYGFFTIPGESEWVLIINKSWDMHLADDYNQENDILRINVKPKKNKTLVEALTYEVIATGKSQGQVKLSWENLNVSFDFANQ